MSIKKKDDVLIKNPKLSDRVAVFYSQMEEIRTNLLETIEKISQKQLDYTPNEAKVETIGTLLLHIAAVEWSWIFEDVDGREMDFEEWKYAFPLRKEVNIPQLKGKKIVYYLDKLKKVREEVFLRLTRMKDDELDSLIGEEEGKCSIEWILYHIIEHEIQHYGQIKLLKRLFELKQKF